MWTVVYVSQSLQTSRKLVDVLLCNKVISKLRRATSSDGGDGTGCFEVLVPSTELEAAQDLIIENELF